MCGLVGVAGEVGGKEERMFADMLMLDTIRGKHSTGVAAISQFSQQYNLHVTKAAKSGPDFVETPGFKSVMSRINRILLGHNRLATRGAINDENAHPFEFSNLVGAHNGSLAYYTNMFEHEKFSVDSQALYSDINKNGIDVTWGKMDGAAALTWIDTEDLTVNFLRNKERPLYYAYGNKGRTLVWASEPWMIMVAAARNGVEMEDKCHDVSVNTLFKFEVPLTADKKEKIALKRREVKPYVRPATYYSGYRDWGGNSSSGEYRSAGKAFLEKEGVDYGETVFFTVDTIKDFTNTLREEMADVVGKSIGGTPVRILNINADKNDALLIKMWEEEDGVFRGRVSYADEKGIVLSAYSIESCGYTLQDLGADDDAENLGDTGEGNHSAKKQEDVKGKPALKVIPYRIACSYCRIMTNAYYTDKDFGITVCCEDCWDNHMAPLTTAQRSAINNGAFSGKH